MPNYCNYGMKIKGKKENVDKMISYLQADYEYIKAKNIAPNLFEEDDIEYYKLDKCTADKHFFRVFEAEHDKDSDEEREDGMVAAYVQGYCAWSVHSCMFSGPHTYYTDWNQCKCDDFRGTHMQQATKDLGLVVEIFSEESGCCFMEHFVVDKGEIIENECVDWEELYDEDGEPILDENGEQMSKGGLDWDFTI